MITDTRAIACLALAGYADAVLGGAIAAITCTPQQREAWEAVKATALAAAVGTGTIQEVRRSFFSTTEIVVELYAQVAAIQIALGIPR